jgi:TonB family protein
MKNLARFFLLVLLATCAIAQSGDASASAAPVRVTENVKVKKVVETPYPLRAQQEQIQGRVVLDVTVGENGKVKKIDVLSGNDVLASAFKDAVKHWEFEPQIMNGKAVRFVTSVGMNFALQGNVLKDDKPAASVALQASTAAFPKNSDSSNPRPDRVRVSSGVASDNLIHKVQPVYPMEARSGHVQGTVVLHALIGTDGIIKKLDLVSGPTELTQAAIGAVEQWRYRPYLLNGVPVEVETKIQVNFKLY